MEATIVSGEFHPYLADNHFQYFDAFEIYPNKFKIVTTIDLKAPKGDETINVLIQARYVLNLMKDADIISLRNTVPTFLSQLKKSFGDFKMIHPELDLERSIMLINECIENTTFLREERDITKDEMDKCVEFIYKNYMDAMGSLIVA